jgi:hypothetical protein
MKNLKLKIEYWPIEKLLPYARNPRKNDDAVERGASFIKEFGFSVPVLVQSDGTIIDGHLRLKCAKRLGMKEVPVTVRDDMTDVQIKAFRLSVNRFSELADWDDELLKLELMELDNLQYDVDLLGFDVDIDGDNTDKDSASDDEQYTKKIKAPIYEIKGEKPKIEDLYDGTKTNQLIEQISNADMPPDIANFLKLAAYRHMVFSYEKIAEYYAHAPKEIQDLMENSALVIIDFNKAIENGFVVLAKELAEIYSNDNE